MSNIHKSEEGIALELLVDSGQDISTATALQIILQNPKGSDIIKTATFTTDGTDGLLRYVVTSGDLNSVGVWRIRGKFTLGSEKKNTTWGTFTVYDQQ